MVKKYQIFISSTYMDLIQEREKVRDVILSLYQFPIGMEMFSAGNVKQWEIIKETISSSDYYILIIGMRYGSVLEDGPDKGMSYTEKEYRYAKSLGIPIIAYFKDEKTITMDKTDNDHKKLKKLEAFKKEVQKGREVKWFSNVDQLGTEVSLSLHKEMEKGDRPGWIRDEDLQDIIELRSNNKALIEENERLSNELDSEKKRNSSERKPYLDISLAYSIQNSEQHPEYYQHKNIMQIEEDETIRLKLVKISTESIKKEYEPITRGSIPQELSRFITDDEIRNYNAALPAQSEIEKYVRIYTSFLRLKENGVATRFIIHNNGKAKATDISITIQFPEEILVFDIDEAMHIPTPQEPDKGKDLLKIAEYRAQRELATALDLKKPQIEDFYSYVASDGIRPLSSMVLTPKTSIYQSITVGDNAVNITDQQGIVHTKTSSFDGIYIVPYKAGEYEIKATIMCAEYESPQVRIIKVVVEE